MKYDPTHQGRVKSRAFDAYTGIGVLVRGGVGGAVDADAARVLQGCQPRLVILAGADALARHRIRHQRPSGLAALRGARGRRAPGRERPRHAAGRAAGGQRAAPGGGRRARVRRGLAGHQQLKKKNKT